MDIKINQLHQVNQVTKPPVQESDGSFKFTLVSHIEDQSSGETAAYACRDNRSGQKAWKAYGHTGHEALQELIRMFLNEIVSRSHKLLGKFP